MGKPLHGKQFWTCSHIIKVTEIFKFEAYSRQAGYVELHSIALIRLFQGYKQWKMSL